MPQDRWVERVVRYQYLEPLLHERRVLEVGCGTGRGADLVASYAREVVAVETSPLLLSQAKSSHGRPNLRFQVGDPDRLSVEDRSFDVVLVPELQRWIARGTLVPEIRRVLAPSGLAMFAVPSGDSGVAQGLSYGDLVEYCATAFDHVRLVGEIPFAGTIMADFEPDEDLDPELDCSLVEEDEPPTHYLALCSDEPLRALGYTVVQVPEVVGAATGDVSQLRGKLDRTRGELEEAAARADDWAGRARQAQAEASDRAEQLEAANVRVQQLESELSLVRAADVGRDIDLVAAYQKLKEDRDRLVARVDELERLPRRPEQSEPDIEELQRKLADAERRVLEASSEGRHEITQLRRELREYQERAEQQKEELESVKAALNEARTMLAQAGDGRHERGESAEGESDSGALRSWAEGLMQRLDRERERVEEERERAERTVTDLVTERSRVEVERQRADGAERMVEELRAAAEQQRVRAEGAERRCDDLVARIEQGAAELSTLHQRVAELQGLRQSDRWRLDELTGRLREAEARSGEAAAGRTAATAASGAHRREIEQRDARIAELEKQLQRAESRTVETERRATNAESQIAQMDVRLKRSEREAATLSKWAEELRDEAREARGESRLRPKTPEPEVQALRNDLERARERISDLEQRCDRLIDEAERANEQLKRAQMELEDARAVHGDGERVAAELRRARKRIAEIEPTSDKLVRAQHRVEQLEGELREAERKLEERAAQPQGRAGNGQSGRGVVAAEVSVDNQTEILEMRKRQLDAMLEGAMVHKRETERMQARLAEMAELVDELRGERDSLERKLRDCRRRNETEGQRAERYRRELSTIGRQLAEAEGELKRYRARG